jgi:hypothetical protein
MRYRYMAIVLKLFLLLCALESAQSQGSITLDHVEGAVDGNKILGGRKAIAYLRFTNNSPEAVDAAVNAFRVYSPDSAQWTPKRTIIVYPDFEDTIYYGMWIDPVESPLSWCCAGSANSMFSQSWVFTRSDDDGNPDTPHVYGEGSDSVIFFGDYGGFGYPGVPVGLSEIAWAVEIALVRASDTGKTLCLDSVQYLGEPDGNGWVWYNSSGQISPEWDGPHCFTITDKCCWGMRGNINLDWKDTIDISDLTSLVGWMFKSGSAPPCMLEADVDGNSDHDIADVTHLVGYMFKGGSEPAGCP